MEDFLKSLSFKKGTVSWSLFFAMIFLSLFNAVWPGVIPEYLSFDASQIFKGQIWRIVTPALMHADLMHCLSCACWLIFIGNQIESSFGSRALILLIILLGCISNCFQCYYCGPSFCGFSAIAVGLGAFLFRRQYSFRETFYFPRLEKVFLLGHPFGSFTVSLCLFYGISPSFFLEVDRLIQFIGPSCTHVAHHGHFTSMAIGWLFGGLFFLRSSKSELIDLFIFAGEHSSDTHGFYLLQELKNLDPSLKMCGVGGSKMRMLDPSFLSMDGFLISKPGDFLFKRLQLWFRSKKLVTFILSRSVKTVIIIDYPGALALIAKKLRKRGYQGKIIQYICPSLFFWKSKAKQIAAGTLDALLTIFPFEKEFLNQLPVPAHYVGNPMLDDQKKWVTNLHWKEKIGLPCSLKCIGIFPGSRLGVIKRNLPHQLKAALALQNENPGLFIGISGFNDRCEKYIARVTRHLCNVFLVPRVFTNDLMKESCLAIASCGTTALELALHNVPSVVTYKYSVIEKTFEERYIKWPFPYRCLVNVLGNQIVFPEFIYNACKWDKIYTAVKLLYDSEEKRHECISACKKISLLLNSESNTSKNVANFIISFL